MSIRLYGLYMALVSVLVCDVSLTQWDSSWQIVCVPLHIFALFSETHSRVQVPEDAKRDYFLRIIDYYQHTRLINSCDCKCIDYSSKYFAWFIYFTDSKGMKIINYYFTATFIQTIISLTVKLSHNEISLNFSLI